MEQTYSVQQIKFELLSYLKEFGTHGPDWTIALVRGPDDAAIKHVVNDESDAQIWICKPAISAKAAQIIAQHMVSRFNVNFLPTLEILDANGEYNPSDLSWVMMFRSVVQHAPA